MTEKAYVIAWSVEEDETIQEIMDIEKVMLDHGVKFDAGAYHGFREWFLDFSHEGIRVDENVGGKMTYAIKFDLPIKVAQELGEKMIDLGFNISVSMDEATWTIGKNNQKIDLTTKELETN